MRRRENAIAKYYLRSIFVLLMATLTVILSVSPVFSDTSGIILGKNYVVVKGGMFAPGSTDLKGFSTGFNGEVGYGRYINPYFALELGLGYYQTSNSVSGSVSSGSDYMSGTAKLDLWVIPATLAVKLIYPIQQCELYALGGAGAYFVNSKFSYSGTATIGGQTYNGSSSSNSNTAAFGGFAGAGANFNFTNNWYIGAEGKYLWTRPTLSFEGTDVTANLYGWIVTGNVGYKF